MKKTMRKYKFLFPVFGIIALIGFGGIVMLLWNWLMPVIFGLTAITFWQALGLFALSRLLFSGMGKGGFGRHKGMHHGGCDKHFMKEKWMQMTPEERMEMFKNRKGFGFGNFMGQEQSTHFSEDKKETPTSSND